MNIKYIKETDGDKNRFVAFDDSNEAGEITFVNAGDTMIIIDHTSVNDTYRGQGIGQKLVEQVVNYARNENKKIVPLCPFAKSVFDANTEYQKLT